MTGNYEKLRKITPIIISIAYILRTYYCPKYA